MTLGAKYTTYPAENFAAAMQRMFNNYSEKGWENADYADRVWARGTLAGIAEDLGPSIGSVEAEERIDSLRMSNLAYGETFNRVWVAIMGRFQPKTSNFGDMADVMIAKLADESPGAEVTDAQVEVLGNHIYGPAVVWDREKIRNGLAQALQTR